MLIDSETSEICQTLLQRAGQGDTVAFAELYDRTAPAVYGLIRSVLPDVEQADDATFTVYVQAWRTASRYDPGRDDVSSLLMATARRHVLDRIRPTSSRVGPRHRAVRCEEVADLGGCRSCAQLLAAVPVASREVLLWIYFGGQSLDEAAELLGITEAAAIPRLNDALASLRQCCGRHSADVSAPERGCSPRMRLPVWGPRLRLDRREDRCAESPQAMTWELPAHDHVDPGA